MKKTRYLKPSGREMEVNDTDAIRDYAAINGWEEVRPKPKAKTKKNDNKTQLDKLI